MIPQTVRRGRLVTHHRALRRGRRMRFAAFLSVMGATPKDGSSRSPLAGVTPGLRPEDRPTVPPPFDPVEFARQSESRRHEPVLPAPSTPHVPSFQRPKVPTFRWERVRRSVPSAPDLEEGGGDVDVLDVLGPGVVP